MSQAMPPLTDDEIAAMEARCAAATPGPWRKEGSFDAGNGLRIAAGAKEIFVCRVDGSAMRAGIDGSWSRSRADASIDAAFIAHARTDLPRVIAEVRRLRAMCDDYELALADKRRLARELDVAMHGEQGAAKQASLCDLVDSARQLRAANAIMHEALTEIAEEIDAGRHDGLPEPAPAHDADVMFGNYIF